MAELKNQHKKMAEGDLGVGQKLKKGGEVKANPFAKAKGKKCGGKAGK